jgi:hypothetical protein
MLMAAVLLDPVLPTDPERYAHVLGAHRKKNAAAAGKGWQRAFFAPILLRHCKAKAKQDEYRTMMPADNKSISGARLTTESRSRSVSKW